MKNQPGTMKTMKNHEKPTWNQNNHFCDRQLLLYINHHRHHHHHHGHQTNLGIVTQNPSHA